MGIIAVTGTIVHTAMTGSSNGSEVPMAIVSGLTGFLGRGVLTSHELQASQKHVEEEEAIAENVPDDGSVKDKDDGLKIEAQSNIVDKRNGKK
jgi:hypothetical protein